MNRPIVRFDIVSLFPEFFAPWQTLGVCGRAVGQQRVEVVHWNPRQFTDDPHQTIDDRPYGGGPGMVMMPVPLACCVQAIRMSVEQAYGPGSANAGVNPEAAPRLPGPVILFSPAGEPLTQAWIETQRRRILSMTAPDSQETPEPRAADRPEPEPAPAQFTLVCGRYEGIDQRFIDRYVDQEISLGDFVLSGGEIAALALMDGLVRRLPGVLNDALSSEQESFMAPMLDYPHYTRPEVFEDQPVPSVLLSGHHGKIEDWRKKQALLLTQSRRPDLLIRSD
jgi:tRNA (guanine37-N1)-methyltransferase